MVLADIAGTQGGAELLRTARDQADAIRHAIAQERAEVDLELAAHREAIERANAEMFDQAKAEADGLLADAASFAKEAEERVADAMTRADAELADAERRASDQLESARRTADRLVADARDRAQQLLADARRAAERERSSAHREIEDLERQRESITAYLDELRGILGSSAVPNVEPPPQRGAAAPEAVAPAGSDGGAASSAPQAANQGSGRTPSRPATKGGPGSGTGKASSTDAA